MSTISFNRASFFYDPVQLLLLYLYNDDIDELSGTPTNPKPWT